MLNTITVSFLLLLPINFGMDIANDNADAAYRANVQAVQNIKEELHNQRLVIFVGEFSKEFRNNDFDAAYEHAEEKTQQLYDESDKLKRHQQRINEYLEMRFEDGR